MNEHLIQSVFIDDRTQYQFCHSQMTDNLLMATGSLAQKMNLAASVAKGHYRYLHCEVRRKFIRSRKAGAKKKFHKI